MSKLQEKLERISEGNAQPLGFGPAVARTKIAPMLVIASVPARNTELIAIATKEGADALLVSVENLEKDNKSLARIGRDKVDMPWGVSLDTVTRQDIEKLIEIGCDFVIFTPAKTPAEVLTEERIGKVLKIDTSMTDSLARSVNRLQVDAVLISPASGDESNLTVHQLMMFERLAGVTGKHLLAAMPPGLSAAELEIFWGLEVRGLVVDLTVEQPERRLSEVKQAIQKLPATRKKTKEKMRATLPMHKASAEKSESEEDEEEEP